MAFIIWDAIKWSSAGMGHLATCDPPSYPCSHMINPSTMIRQSDEDDVLRPVEGSPKVLHGAVCLLWTLCSGKPPDETASRPTFLLGSSLKACGVLLFAHEQGVQYASSRSYVQATYWRRPPAGPPSCLAAQSAPCSGYTLDETASRPTFLPGSGHCEVDKWLGVWGGCAPACLTMQVGNMRWACGVAVCWHVGNMRWAI
eukprot:1161142-Pelagomonas_calceolata.AAC.6